MNGKDVIMKKIYFNFYNGQAQTELIFLTKCDRNFGVLMRGDKEHMDVRDAARFLASLYFKVETDYKCDKPKIEKLLSIAQIIRLGQNRFLFNADIYSKDCGLGVKEIAGSIFINVHTGIVNNGPIKDEIQNISNPPLYKLDHEINEEDTVLLNNVFIQFGSYDSQRLGQYLNEFKNNILNDNKVSASKVYSYFKEKNEDAFKNNPIFQFLVREIHS